MVVDTSILVAIVLSEPGYQDLVSRVAEEVEPAKLSAASYLEASIVLIARLGPAITAVLDRVIAEASLVLQPVTVEQVNIARDAFLRFGKGRHPAKLNFGDCFAYALAKQLNEALLFKGDDFSKTDIRIA